MKETYPTTEIARAMGITEQAVRKRAEVEGWPYITKKGRGRGGISKEYRYAKLPKDVQKALDLRDLKVMVEQLPPVNTPQPPALIKEEERPLTPWQEKEGLARADLVRHYREDSARNTNGGGLVAAKKLFVQAYNSGQLYPEIFAILKETSYQTLERWAVTAKKAGGNGNLLKALAPRHGDHLRGRRRVGGVAGDLKRLMESEAAKILLGVALHPNKPRIAEAIKISRLIMTVQGKKMPESDATCRRFLEDFKAQHFDQWVFYREGEHALDEKCLPYLEGNYDFEVGEVLVADGHILNWETLNPWTGKPKRMTLILWHDMKSSFPLGWEVMPTENTQAIAAALRRAILRLGVIPRVAYMDNGRAFGSKYFGGKNLKECGFEGLFGRLGVRPVYAWPYHGMSKPIERFFGTFGEIERLAPTYTGTSIMDKPAWRNRGEKLHVRMHQKMTGGRIPTLAETLKAIAGWFDLYVQRPQKGRLAGKSPLEVFLGWYGRPERERSAGGDACATIDEEELRHLMMSTVVRTIGRNGVSLPGKGHYYSEELYGRKHQVTVRYDDQDPRAVWIYGPDGEFICRAESRAQVHRMALLGDEEDRRQVAEQIQEKLLLKKQTISSARAFTAQVMLPETQEKMKLLGFEGGSAAGTPAPSQGKRISQITAQDVERTQREFERGAEVVYLADAEEQSQAEPPEAEDLSWRELDFLPEMDRYEKLLELAAQGLETPARYQTFMSYFEKGPIYTANREWLEERRLQLAAFYQVKEETHGIQ